MTSELRYGFAGIFALVENGIHSVENRHLYMMILIDEMHASGGIIALSHHIHFHHGSFYRVAAANHSAEIVITAES